MIPKIFFVTILTSHFVFATVPTEQESQWKKYHDTVLKNPVKAQSLASQALKSKDWYMREAGLKTLVAVNPSQAKVEARKILENDPAMLVRASAVTALKILKDKDSEDVLWKSLEDSRNFRKDQSLWIRPQIMATLIEFKSVNKDNFKKFYDDKDPQVARLARSVK